jgi:hypothetical protein
MPPGAEPEYPFGREIVFLMAVALFVAVPIPLNLVIATGAACLWHFYKRRRS